MVDKGKFAVPVAVKNQQVGNAVEIQVDGTKLAGVQAPGPWKFQRSS